jgi:hypothetical protein
MIATTFDPESAPNRGSSISYGGATQTARLCD